MKRTGLVCTLLLLGFLSFGQRFAPAFDGISPDRVNVLIQDSEDDGFYFSGGSTIFHSSGDSSSCTLLAVVNGLVKDLTVNKTQGLLAVATADWIRYYQLSDERLADSLHIGVPGVSIRKICLSPDGSLIAIACSDHHIRLFDVQNKQLRFTLSGHTNEITALLFIEKGRTLISGSGDKTIRIWSVVDGTIRNVLTGHRNWVRSLAVSPDSLYLASGGDDRRVFVWSLSDSTHNNYLYRTPKQHANWIAAIKYAENGRLLSLGHDNRIIVWSPKRGAIGFVSVGDYKISKSVERQPITFAIGKKHEFYVGTLGDGLLMDPYFRLKYREAHPLTVVSFNGFQPSPNGYFSALPTARIRLDIGRTSEISALIVENLTNGTADTLTGNYAGEITLQLPQKKTDFRLRIVDEDAKVPVEYRLINVYRIMESRRRISELFPIP